MPWRLRVLPASFRGIGFGVSEHDSKIAGRRVHIHEYPRRDLPFTEDLGKRTDEFGIEGYVIGDLYSAHRDLLVAACDLPGPGELVHPTLGIRQVVCVQCDVTERASEGGMARFSFRFIDAGLNQFPTNRANTRSVVLARARTAQQSVIGQFLSAFVL